MLCFQGEDLLLRGYSDADWGGDLDECKSTSEYAFLLAEGAVSWSSKKQSCLALSTMKSKYIACSATMQEAVWLRRFLWWLGVTENANDPIMIYNDSMTSLAYTKDPKYHELTKHIDIRYHFVRDMIVQ